MSHNLWPKISEKSYVPISNSVCPNKKTDLDYFQNIQKILPESPRHVEREIIWRVWYWSVLGELFTGIRYTGYPTAQMIPLRTSRNILCQYHYKFLNRSRIRKILHVTNLQILTYTFCLFFLLYNFNFRLLLLMEKPKEIWKNLIYSVIFISCLSMISK